MISTILFKIGASLLLVVVAFLIVDAAGYSSERTPAWIYVPGGVSAIIGGLCILIGGILMIWGL